MLFRDKLWFLSNMCKVDVSYEGEVYQCVESAFQAAKCKNKKDRLKFVALNGFEARKLGKEVAIKKNWNDIRIDVMRGLLVQKFNSVTEPWFGEWLGKVEGKIAEDNWWGDTFWGRVNGTGANHLGRLLMEIRDSR